MCNREQGRRGVSETAIGASHLWMTFSAKYVKAPAHLHSKALEVNRYVCKGVPERRELLKYLIHARHQIRVGRGTESSLHQLPHQRDVGCKILHLGWEQRRSGGSECQEREVSRGVMKVIELRLTSAHMPNA